jgi:hypothetical protein
MRGIRPLRRDRRGGMIGPVWVKQAASPGAGVEDDMKRSFWSLTLLLAVAVALAYWLLVRPYIMQWGATNAEAQMALPGDPYIHPQAVVSTRALTIHAPAGEVWSWLVQIGQGRGGFYSFDWLENLFAAGMRNAEAVTPALQSVAVGDKIYYQEGSFYEKVSVVEPGRALALGGWTYYLQPVDGQTTRLIVRYPSFPVVDTASAIYYYGAFEPLHFIMEAGFMLGLKERAERGQEQLP